MSNIKNYEYDCTIKCNCRKHANTITAALTKRSIPNEKLAAFIAKSCRNFADNCDDLGRSAVHVAASVDRYEILEWLLNQSAIIHGRDLESGSTALHRAIYYGCIDCAVLLARYGASFEILDNDTYTPLYSVCRIGDYTAKLEFPPRNEVLVWGLNRNYNLGTGNGYGCDLPQTIDFFRKHQTSIKAVALSPYHTLFLDHQHHLYAVGHGKGGRLGTKSEDSLPTPKKVKLSFESTAHIICMSVSRQHSLLLTNKSTVFAAGINDSKQLGVSNAGDKLTVFKEVATLRDYIAMPLKAVIAKDDHSIAHSDKQLFFWGANYGQFGIEDKMKLVVYPRLMKMPLETKIVSVVASNCATVVLTGSNTMLLYYNYKTKSIKPPNYETIESICMDGGDNTNSLKGSASGLKLLVLTKTNVLFIWHEITQHYYRCMFTPLRFNVIDKIFYKSNQILLLSKGDIYKGKCHQIKSPQSKFSSKFVHPSQIWNSSDRNRPDVATEHLINIEVECVSHIDRATDVFCTDDFTSFAALQESPLKYFKVPALLAEKYTFKKLFNDASEFDAVHDVVLHVDDEIYAVHKFIIYTRSPGLRELISAHTEKDVYLKFDGFTGKMLEIILKHIYTNYYPNVEDLDNIQRSLGPDNPNDSGLVCKLFLLYAEKFQLTDLCNYLKSLEESSSSSFATVPKGRFKRLQRSDFPELYDVRINCGDNAELSAHKCILVARLEYFEMMFAHTWSEQKVINLETVPVAYMEPILDFLYNCDVELFRKQNYSETFLYNMIVFCDQFFVERLRKICEIMILDKITIRKCGEMLDFAHTYNCEALKLGSLNFICQNLTRVLLNRSLDKCDPEALKCINGHYRSIFKSAFDYRVITPHAVAIDDDLLYSFVDDFEVDLNYRMKADEDELNKGATKQKAGESKYKQSTRQHERDAIATMMKSLTVDDKTNLPKDENSKLIENIQETDEKLHGEYKSWLKVSEKKDQKRKYPVPFHPDEITAINDKEKFSLTPLGTTTPNPVKSNTVTPEKITLPEDNSTPSKTFNFSFADFTPARDKLSQKQRKRLSSGSSNWRNNSISEQPVPTVTTPSPPQPNAWNLNAQSPTSPSLAFNTAADVGSSSDPNSFANKIKLANTKQSGTASSSAAGDNSFARILAEERKQREYYERMRSKSLVLTQIEETAIAELRAFYNVDNACDEIITVERKPMPSNINFAQWQNKK